MVFSATTSGPTSEAATVVAAATVAKTVNLTSLPDRPVAITALTRDLAGNRSAPVAPTNAVIKDTVVPPLAASYSGGLLGLTPTLRGSSECAVTIVAARTGATTSTKLIESGTAFSTSVQGTLLGLGSISYAVTATDRAGNVSPVVTASN